VRKWGIQCREVLAWLLVLCLTACVSSPRTPVPATLQTKPRSRGWAEPIRFWGDQLPPNADQMVKGHLRERWRDPLLTALTIFIALLLIVLAPLRTNQIPSVQS
jgi:hypothetical protein